MPQGRNRCRHCRRRYGYSLAVEWRKWCSTVCERAAIQQAAEAARSAPIDPSLLAADLAILEALQQDTDSLL